MSWKWVTDSQSSLEHGSSLEQGILSRSCTATLRLPGSSTSAWKVEAAAWRYLHQHLHQQPLGKEWSPILFLISEKHIEFPSKTTGVQVFCLCKDEVFLPALGVRVSCGLKETCSPWPMQSLTLPGACSSTICFAVGTQQGPDQPHQTWPRMREELPKPIPPQGPLGRGPAAVSRRWAMDHLWERNDAPPPLQEAALVPGFP